MGEWRLCTSCFDYLHFQMLKYKPNFKARKWEDVDKMFPLYYPKSVCSFPFYPSPPPTNVRIKWLMPLVSIHVQESSLFLQYMCYCWYKFMLSMRKSCILILSVSFILIFQGIKCLPTASPFHQPRGTNPYQLTVFHPNIA